MLRWLLWEGEGGENNKYDDNDNDTNDHDNDDDNNNHDNGKVARTTMVPLRTLAHWLSTMLRPGNAWFIKL